MTDESPDTPGLPDWTEDQLDDSSSHIPMPGLSDEELLADIPRVYSTAQAAKFFEKSNQWLYWGMRNSIFAYPNGDLIEPERISKGGRRRFTLPIIKEIALSCYRRGNFNKEELAEVLRKITMAEKGYDINNVEPETPEETISEPVYEATEAEVINTDAEHFDTIDARSFVETVNSPPGE